MPIIRGIIQGLKGPQEGNGNDVENQHGRDHKHHHHREHHHRDHRETRNEPPPPAPYLEETEGAPPRDLNEKGREEEEEKGSLIDDLIKAILPCGFFALGTSEGRHDYVNFILEGRVGKILDFLPFILVMCIVQAHPLAAIWVAFGISLLIAQLQFYRSTYKPNCSRLYWFSACYLITYLVMGIVYIFMPFDALIVGNIVISAMFLTVLLSLLVRRPFTMQVAKEKVPEEVAAAPGFLKLNMILTGFWLFLFAIMMFCSWGAYPLPTNSTGNLVLGTIIPILVPVIGGMLTPMLAQYIVGKAKEREEQAQKTQEAGDHEEEEC